MSVNDTEHPIGETGNNLRGAVTGTVVQAGTIHGNINITGNPTDSFSLIPRQLPRTTDRFVGRHDELATLTRWMAESEKNHVTTISVIDGAGGIGKTALALYWASQVADRFPGGQLYINLQGFHPAATPTPPRDALQAFLNALGVPSGSIPDNLDARAALYRSVVHGRPLLIVLDNAANSEQVRPLLPNAPNCVVLVTSRLPLDGLTIRDSARQITLGFPTTDECRELLARQCGEDRISAAPEVVDEVIRRCAQLPLALAIVAAQVNNRPTLSFETLTNEVRDELAVLDALEIDDDAGVRGGLLLVISTTLARPCATVPTTGAVRRPGYRPRRGRCPGRRPHPPGDPTTRPTRTPTHAGRTSTPPVPIPRSHASLRERTIR